MILSSHGKTETSSGRWVDLSRPQPCEREDDDLREGRRLRGLRASTPGSCRANGYAAIGILRDAQPLASGGLAAGGRRPFSIYGLVNVDTHPTLARSPTQHRQRTRVSGPVQVVRSAGRRSLLDGLSLRGTKCPACESRAARRGLALGELAPLEAWYCQGAVVAGHLAVAATPRMGGTRQRRTNRSGVGGPASVGQSRQPIRPPLVVRSNGASVGSRKHTPPQRTTEEAR